MSRISMFLIIASLLFSACTFGAVSPLVAQQSSLSAGSTEKVTLTATQPEPTDTSTPLPPTATSIPTKTPTPLPPIPTADFAPADVYGTWTIWDAEAGGPNFLKFYDDGVYTAHHGPSQNLIHSGKYTLEGRLLTFQDSWYCPEDQQVGSYLVKLGPNKDWIIFQPYDDPCRERAYDFRSRVVRWNRFVPTATP